MNIWEICTTFVCTQKYKQSTYISEFKTEFGEQQKTKWDKKKKDFVVVFSVVASTSIKHKKSKAKNEKKKKYRMSK